jgi:hypoxanthine-guanine phosphoribosyltransferase
VSRVLIPVLSPHDAQPEFISRISTDASVVYVLLVLDKDSLHSSFGFKTSEIMRGREVVEKIKEEIKKNKRLCTDILEWGNTIEKIAQIAEMKQVDKIVLYNAEKNEHFHTIAEDIAKKTPITVEIF